MKRAYPYAESATAKRSGKRTYKQMRRAVAVAKPLQITPLVSKTVLTYTDCWYFNTGAGAAFIVNTFRLNGLHDPDVTGAGGTPTGLLAWAGFFGKYKVYGCFIEAEFISNCSQALICGYKCYVSGTGYTTPTSSTLVQQTLGEQSNVKSQLLGPSNVGNGNTYCKLTKYVSMRKMLSPHEFNDAAAGAAVNADPTSSVLMDVMISDALAATSNNVVWAWIRLHYYVNFYSPGTVTTD